MNGIEVERLAKETQAKLESKELVDLAKNGKRDAKAVSVGRIMKKMGIEKFKGELRAL